MSQGNASHVKGLVNQTFPSSSRVALSIKISTKDFAPIQQGKDGDLTALLERNAVMPIDLSNRAWQICGWLWMGLLVGLEFRTPRELAHPQRSLSRFNSFFGQG